MKKLLFFPSSRLSKEVFGVSFVGVFSILLGYILTIVMARLMGVYGMGVYSFSMSILLVMLAFPKMGMAQLIQREVAGMIATRTTSLIKILIHWSMRFVMTLAFLVCVLFFLITEMSINLMPLPKEYLEVVSVGMAILFTLSIGEVFSSAVRGFGKVAIGQIPLMVLLKFITIATVLFLFFVEVKITPIVFMWSFVIASFISCLASFFFYLIFKPVTSIMSTATCQIKEWKKSNLTLGASTIIAQVNQQTAMIFTGLLLLPDSAGLLRVALQLSIIVLLIKNFVDPSISPYIVRFLKRNKKQALQSLITKSTNKVAYFSLLITMFFLFFGDWLLLIMFGSEFLEAKVLLNILAIGQFIHVAVGPAGLILNMSGCERYTYRVVAFSTIFNIILCFFLIDIYGVVGVAVSASISISMQNILLSFIVFYKLDINTLPSFKLKLN